MTLENWLSFVFASALLLIIPGPVVLLVITSTLERGKIALVPLASGAALGDAGLIILSTLGLSITFKSNPQYFTFLAFCASGYLFYLGSKMILTSFVVKNNPIKGKEGRKGLFSQAFALTAFHPSGIIFFTAFLSVFIDTSTNILSQMMILSLTFIGLSMINIAAWVYFAGRMKRLILESNVNKAIKIATGLMFIILAFTSIL